MMGFYEKLQANKDEEKKYFDVVHREEGFRKIHVIASARAYWPMRMATAVTQSTSWSWRSVTRIAPALSYTKILACIWTTSEPQNLLH